MRLQNLVQALCAQFSLDLTQIDRGRLLADPYVGLLVDECLVQNAVSKRRSHPEGNSTDEGQKCDFCTVEGNRVILPKPLSSRRTCATYRSSIAVHRRFLGRE